MAKTIKNKIVYEEEINNLKGKATAIVFPESVQEIKNLVKLSKSDIIPRGSGSSLTGAVSPKNSVIIDFSKMNKILQIDSDKKTAIVEPGVLLTELNESLEPYNLIFPIEPIFNIETIGGVIAKNSSGNREIKYSRPMNWINSLEVVNSKGETQKISKSDLSDFVGMEGITGIILKATLKLTSIKKRTLTVLKSNKLEDVINAGKRLKLDAEVSAVDLFSREVSVFLGMENRYHLFVEYESDKGNFRGEDYANYIKLKSKAYKKSALEGFYHIESVKFLSDSLQDFLLYLEENKIPFFSHMASGVVYPLFRADEREKQRMDEALKFAKRLRGRIGYTLGVGLTKKELLEFGEAALIKRVKNRLDPDNKFNHDKLISHKLAEISSEKAEKMEEINKQNLELQAKQEEENEKARQLLEKIEREAHEKNKIEEKLAEEIIGGIKENSPEEKPEEQKPENNEEIQIKEKSEEKVLTVGDLLKQAEEKNSKRAENKKDEPEKIEEKAEQENLEEREKIKKIAAGFFAGGRDTREENQ